MAQAIDISTFIEGGEDIRKEDFWLKGIALCEKDVEEFIALTSK
ncbi:hypothetical protein MKX73_16370 [Solibacillus sp. FSL W7-1436]